MATYEVTTGFVPDATGTPVANKVLIDASTFDQANGRLTFLRGQDNSVVAVFRDWVYVVKVPSS